VNDSEVTWPVVLFVRLLGRLVWLLLFPVPVYLVFIKTIAQQILTWSDCDSCIFQYTGYMFRNYCAVATTYGTSVQYDHRWARIEAVNFVLFYKELYNVK
jgi:hypothetical protein